LRLAVRDFVILAWTEEEYTAEEPLIFFISCFTRLAEQRSQFSAGVPQLSRTLIIFFRLDVEQSNFFLAAYSTDI
jgi:hypothetical protein